MIRTTYFLSNWHSETNEVNSIHNLHERIVAKSFLMYLKISRAFGHIYQSFYPLLAQSALITTDRVGNKFD